MGIRFSDSLTLVLVSAGLVLGGVFSAQGHEVSETGAKRREGAPVVAGVPASEFCLVELPVAPTKVNRPGAPYPGSSREIALYEDNLNLELGYLGRELSRRNDRPNNPRAVGLEVTFQFGGAAGNVRKAAVRRSTRTTTIHRDTWTAPGLAHGIDLHPSCS